MPATTAIGLPENLTLFVRETLRDAVLAPNDRMALDIVGAALLRMAALVSVEGHRHG
ncbi:hypothetical protein [Burkholderia gladioli]|uniref:hypothetical protein n=1 Tax=Burkholderia gladioli TaxID=28095 RepID=UPI0016404487|nr:hypothetical protein [Burkholderia gladioli]